MTKVQEIEQQISHLTPEELAAFRKWFVDFDAEIWDRQLESDVQEGKLDALARRALRDHAEGKSTKL